MIYNNSTGSEPLYGGPDVPSAPNYPSNYASDDRYDYSNADIPPSNQQNAPYGHSVPPSANFHQNPYAYHPIQVGAPAFSANRFRCNAACPYFILLSIQLTLMIVSLSVPWFNYCYFAFGLRDEKKIVDKSLEKGSGHNTIIKLYDEVCDPDNNYYKYCPHFCRSIKEVRYSGKIMIGCGITCIILIFLTAVITIIKIKRKGAKIPKFMFYFLVISSFLIYLIGFISYYLNSKFSSFSETKTDWDHLFDSPNDFSWSAGLALSIPILLFKVVAICLTKPLLMWLYN